MKDVIEKAYGSIPKEVQSTLDFFDFIPSRPLKYYLIKLYRKVFR
jgi:hypothetical protein